MLNASIKSFAPVAGSVGHMARLFVTLANSKGAGESAVVDAIQTSLSGHAQVIASSIRIYHDSEYQATATCLVVGNNKVVPVDSKREGFRCINSTTNMFMDEEESLWTLHQTAAGDVMVMSNGFDDIVSMSRSLSSVSSDSYHTTDGRNAIESVSAMQRSVEGGDFVAFCDGTTDLRFGLVVGRIESTSRVAVLAQDTGEVEEVDDLAIVDGVDSSEVPDPKMTEEDAVNIAVSAARGSANVDHIINYFKRIYGQHPEFFAQLSSRIRSHQFAG